MRLLLVLFLGVFITSVCGAMSPLDPMDHQATARAPWKKGEIVKKTRHSDVKFLGITIDGYYLVQQFYSGGDEKRTDLYTVVCPDKVVDKDKFWEACEMTHPIVRWYKEGGKKYGFWTYWHENGQKKAEGHYQNGKQKGLWIEWDENGKEVSRKEFPPE